MCIRDRNSILLEQCLEQRVSCGYLNSLVQELAEYINPLLDLCEKAATRTLNIDNDYSGLYSEIAFIIGIAVIMIDTFFPPEETNANCVWKIILIAVSIVCMFYFAKKVKTVNEVEEEKKFWPNFFIQWATSLGYINMPVAMIAILVTFDKGKAWTLFMMGVAVILTGLTLIEALVKTSKILKKENVGKRK